jgi:hypothetical protein
MREALVVAQVEVGFGTVLGDEHLAVLERAHGARIDVDVGIELEMGDLDAAGFEDRAERGGGDALAQRGHDTAGDEDVLGHFEHPLHQVRETHGARVGVGVRFGQRNRDVERVGPFHRAHLFPSLTMLIVYFGISTTSVSPATSA